MDSPEHPIEREWTPDLEHRIEQIALAAGFDIARVAPTETQPNERFSNWVDAGYAGEMEYLKRRDEQGTLLRSSAQIAIPWAQSIIVCATNYNAPGPLSI